MVFFSISVHNIAIISFVISVDRNVQQNVISFCHERNAVCGTIQSVHKKWPCYKWYALKKILSKTFLLEHLESWLLFLDSYMVKKLFQELWFNPSALWGISFCWVIQSARGKRVQIRNGNNDRQWWDKKKKQPQRNIPIGWQTAVFYKSNSKVNLESCVMVDMSHSSSVCWNLLDPHSPASLSDATLKMWQMKRDYKTKSPAFSV